jgi:hypothetical protein
MEQSQERVRIKKERKKNNRGNQYKRVSEKRSYVK